jgi:hypothetical protein
LQSSGKKTSDKENKMAIRKKAAVAKSADAARQGAMTKTVVKKVSPNVKIIKAGSKPLTQSLTEKRAIMEKAKGNTPAARAQALIEKKAQANRAKRNEAGNRNYVMRETARDALRTAGYKPPAPGTGFGSGPDAAQRKAANKAVAQAEREFKAARAKVKAAEKAARAAAAKAARQNVGGGGLRGGMGNFSGGGGSGRSNVNR